MKKNKRKEVFSSSEAKEKNSYKQYNKEKQFMLQLLQKQLANQLLLNKEVEDFTPIRHIIFNKTAEGLFIASSGQTSTSIMCDVSITKLRRRVSIYIEESLENISLHHKEV